MDDNEFKSVYFKLYKLLFLIANRIAGDIDAANDIVQDVFLNLYEKLDKVKIEKDIHSYLKRAVYYKSLDYVKNIANKKNILCQISHERETESLETLIELAELEEKIYKAVGDLPEQCRQVFMMSRFEGLSNKDIADKKNISIRTVETHISKAIRKLKESLKIIWTIFSLFF